MIKVDNTHKGDISEGIQALEQIETSDLEWPKKAEQRVFYLKERSMYKAVVRRIPTFLSEEAFFHGFNVDMQVNDRLFVHGKQSKATSHRHYLTGKSQNEFSVAYYIFDSREKQHEFVKRFNNFTVHDEKSKKQYVLHVHACAHQEVKNILKDSQDVQGEVITAKDFKHNPQFIEFQQHMQAQSE